MYDFREDITQPKYFQFSSQICCWKQIYLDQSEYQIQEIEGEGRQREESPI